MKCKIFYDEPPIAATLFIQYMRDKTLSKDVIIHTVAFPARHPTDQNEICIVVIHPNWWDEKKANYVSAGIKHGNQERS
uniref:Uncharacterized protein n=1 Tax=viral metagenome TaxID=1070528 RepID=A0A6H1ZWB9_9ZZZZ